MEKNKEYWGEVCCNVYLYLYMYLFVCEETERIKLMAALTHTHTHTHTQTEKYNNHTMFPVIKMALFFPPLSPLLFNSTPTK